ncbi:uncharacterized protein LOC142349573 isoform X2 [Convolutriloba macropyga]
MPEIRDFADYIREKVFGIDTNRLVRLTSLPKATSPVYCKVYFTSSKAVKPVKLNDAKKAVAFTLGHESSVDILERPLWRWLMRAGLTPKELSAHKQKGDQAWLLLIQTPRDVVVQPAHWEGIIDYVQHYHPSVYMAVYTHAFRVRQTPLTEFEKDLGFRFNTCLNDSNLFMSEARLRNRFPERHLPASIAETRLFLYCQLCLDDKFFGDGFVRQFDHQRGAKEYIMPNLDLVGDNFELIPFTYDIPATFD